MALTQISFLVSLFFFFCFLVRALSGENDDTLDSSSPSPPPPLSEEQLDTSQFRPSIAVIAAVLTTMFSITVLLLLYAKHCKHGNVILVYDNRAAGGGGGGSGRLAHYHPCTARKNSGIDRTVVESLPLFRFGSLRGQKDGLECAVCLTRFEPTEVLRLLPKCKHAFHVECVDTWLDSHSTCPLCRYRVDPEDILLIQDVNNFQQQQQQVSPPRRDLGLEAAELNPGYNRRVSGRHSSAGESFAGMGSADLNSAHSQTSCRRSLDSFSSRTAVGCLERPRKDGLLLSTEDDNGTKERRLEHRIIVSAGFQQRWSDVHPSDLLYLRSEMIISDSHRFSSGSWRSSVRKQQQQQSGEGSGVINTRSVSEITGMSRFSSRESNGGSDMNMRNQSYRQRQAGLVSRWLVWISSRSHSLPHPPSDPNTHTSTSV